MNQNYGRIAIREFDLFSPGSIVPTLFYNCGAGYTDGKRNPNGTVEDAKNAQIYAFENSDGSKSFSLLDTSCKWHDVKFAEAQGKPNEGELLAKADVEFVSELISNFSKFEPVEKIYATFAIAAFSVKIAIWDIPRAIVSSVTNQIVEWGKHLVASAENQSLATLTQTDGTIYSCLKDSEGNIVLGCTRGDENQYVTLDEMMKVTGASQQFIDEYGNIYEETKIDIDNSRNLSEIIHRLDGEIDAQGVIVGKINQSKLDQFIELGNFSNYESNSAENHSSSPPTKSTDALPNLEASNLLKSLNVNFDDQNASEINDWFSQADPIRLQAYHWDKVDKNLQNLWYYGNDSTLAAYDLQSVMDANHIDWNADTGQWDFPDWMPPDDMDQFALDYVNSFEYSLSDIDLGFENSPVNVYDYKPSDWWSDSAGSGQSWSNSYIDPLVLKIGKGTVHTTNLQGSTVMFDMAANGQKVRTGWITPDHAFLVRDRNRNGIIDNTSEMFSERTSATAATGFAALAQLDSNRDGWVDYRDKAFKELRLWTDINVDGITQKGELHQLIELGVTHLVVAKPIAKNVYDNGNLILNISNYGGVYPRGFFQGQIAEVLFNYGDSKSVTSIYISDQATAVRTAEGKTMQVLSDKATQTMNASMSGINLLVGGKGDVLNAGNSQQSMLIGNGGATLNGNAGSTHFVVNGAGNTVNTGEGSSFIQVNGDANTINASKGTVDIDVDGNRNKITIGSDDSVDLGGTSNTLSAVGKAVNNEVVISGQKQIVTLNNADIALLENSSVTLNGKNNDITQAGHSTLSGNATGGTLMVFGDDNVATLNNAFVGLTKGAELQLTGKNDQIVMAGDAELVLKGSAAGSTVNAFGDNNQINMTGGTLRMAEGADVDLTGRSNVITMLGDGDLEALDKGQRIEVYGDDNHAAVNGSTINEHGLADLDLDGSLNTVRNTPIRPDLLKKELDSELKTEQLMNTLWGQYEKLADVSIAQQWRQLEPSLLPSEFQPAIYDNGLATSPLSNNIAPQPLVAANASNYMVRTLS